MAKSVSLTTGRTFATVTAAKEYFYEVLSRQELNEEFSGDELADVRAAYEEYSNGCEIIPHLGQMHRPEFASESGHRGW